MILCPKCKTNPAEEIAEEVDIGVGVQRYVIGFDCPTCGQISVCGTCGGFDGEHRDWCTAFGAD